MTWISVFDIFKLGVGPSSSHTMGPMTAGARFATALADQHLAEHVTGLEVRLFASLALTGRGHATDRAAILGLCGERPDTVDPDAAERLIAQVAAERRLPLGGGRPVAFDPDRDIIWAPRERRPEHPNALTFTAFGDTILLRRTYFSIGGGFVLEQGEDATADPGPTAPFPFANAHELLAMAEAAGLSLAELMLENESAFRPREAVVAGLDGLAAAMDACLERGLRQEGVLPGGLDVPRRARPMLQRLLDGGGDNDPMRPLDWVNLWALAVNEENAAGGRVVTAPTNGAAGVIPALLRFYTEFYGGDAEGRRRFLLTAAAVGALYKRNASISAAEVGCQGEVGVAASMAAAGLTAVLGGSNAQVENAAEIAMEHSLGLTCDPIGGLVQIPCIERNAVGAVKAIDAARLALAGDGDHGVSLDKVIATMKRTGEDMNAIYKETSEGGLAVNLPAC